MKKAFTLIELLVVVTIMATLMTIAFRIGNVSNSRTREIKTVTRLQKLENCLSGYYSAFGSYPPVRCYGSRDIHAKVENGVQTDEKEDGLSWEGIEVACRCQPLEVCFPFSAESKELVEVYSQAIQESSDKWSETSRRRYASGITSDFLTSIKGDWDETEWKKVRIFKFGLMSYLLPRYLVMMSSAPEFFGIGVNRPCAQWEENNDDCIDSITGETLTWKEVYDNVGIGDTAANRNRTGNNKDYVAVANMPTQAVCARWIKNLEGICATGDDANRSTIFGVNIKDSGWDMWDFDEESPPNNLNVYSPNKEGGNWYVLNSISVCDGWGSSFYYYSPQGAQTYTLWSAGANGKTFPPWVDKTGYLDRKPRGSDGSEGSLTIADAIADDIVRMHH